MTCKGICSRLKASKPLKGSRYKVGQKRCHDCECFFVIDGMFCPCCGMRLRSKPRSKRAKEMLRN